MKPKALINLPQWTYVVYAAAVLAMAAFLLDLKEYAWGGYCSLCVTLVEIAVWAAIILDLKKNVRIGTGLIVTLGLSLILSLISDVVSLFSDDSIVFVLFLILWIVSMIIIIVSYSGLFKKYAMIEIACILGLATLTVIMGIFDVGTSGAAFSGIMKYGALPLLYLPYQALVNAINEGVEADSEEEESQVSEEGNPD